MQENVPLTVERLSDAQEKEFRVSSPLQVKSYLREISDKGLMVALYFEGVKNFIMTSVLGVGEKGLWVEQGVDESINRRILESKRITFVSVLNQVKVQFAIGAIRAVDHQGYPAFYLPLPANLYRMQHREFFRLMLPHSEHLRCFITVGNPLAGNRREVHVMDISGGGVRLFCTDDDIVFEKGQTYGNCQIELPEVGKIDVALTVRNLVTVSPKPGQVVRRVGCEFKNLDNASSILLQRYVTKIQRSRSAA